MPKRNSFIGVKGYKRRLSPELKKRLKLTWKQKIKRFVNTIRVKRMLSKEESSN